MEQSLALLMVVLLPGEMGTLGDGSRSCCLSVSCQEGPHLAPPSSEDSLRSQGQDLPHPTQASGRRLESPALSVAG